MFCSQCGEQILDNSLFCSFCGSKICFNQNNNNILAKYYWGLAKKYLPTKIKFLLIAESPPKKPKNYFYYTEKDQGNYSFFQNIILAVLKTQYRGDIEVKKILLDMFCKQGFFLTDSVNHPIEKTPEDEITESIPYLFYKRLKLLNRNGNIDSETKIILIKKIVCEILQKPLQDNNDIIFNKKFGVKCVGYPRYYSDKKFIKDLGDVISGFNSKAE